MPNKHRYVPITPRVPRELKDRAQAAAEEMDTDLTALVAAFLRWYVGDLSGLPKRPVPANQAEARTGMHLVECKICRAESQKNLSDTGTATSSVSYRHSLADFPRAYGRNIDSGNDLRADNCGIFGANTGAKLAEYHLPWGWIDESTGARLCCNEDGNERRSCARELFHENHHKDSQGHPWPQRNHYLLTRLEADSPMRHLGLYGTREEAQFAAAYDLGNKDTLEWTPQQRAFQHGGTPSRSNRVTHLITFIDVSQVGEEIAAVEAVWGNVSV
jgi:hypothetical protein